MLVELDNVEFFILLIDFSFEVKTLISLTIDFDFASNVDKFVSIVYDNVSLSLFILNWFNVPISDLVKLNDTPDFCVFPKSELV